QNRFADKTGRLRFSSLAHRYSLRVEHRAVPGHRRDSSAVFQHLDGGGIAWVDLNRPGYVAPEHAVHAEEATQLTTPGQDHANPLESLPQWGTQAERTDTPTVVERRSMQPAFADELARHA